MSTIYFLGFEDREGMTRLLSGKIGTLAYDAEVGGWNNMNTDVQPIRKVEIPQIEEKPQAEEPIFNRVFSSIEGELVLSKDNVEREEPKVTYQLKWGEDQ